jgi:hypothetical protein
VFLEKLYRNATGILVALVIAVITGELSVRYIFSLSTVRYVYDQNIGTKLLPNQRARWTSRHDYNNLVRVNNEGFHDRDHNLEKSPRVYRVVVLGDSFVEALQVPLENGFSALLEKGLNGLIPNKAVEVINLGLSGRGPAQYYRILEKKGLKYQPELVIMAVYPGNDFRDSHPKLSRAPYKTFYRIRKDGDIELMQYSVPHWWHPRALLQRAALAYFLVYEILKRPWMESVAVQLGLIPEINPPKVVVGDNHVDLEYSADGLYAVGDLQPIWSEAFEITTRMIAETSVLAHQHGSKFFVMLIPDSQITSEFGSEESNNGRISKLNYYRPTGYLVKFMEKHSIPFVNLLAEFARDYDQNQLSHRWTRDAHWNERGHALAAVTAPDKILELILTPE